MSLLFRDACDEQDGEGVSTSQADNGFLSSISLLNSENAVQELLQQAPVQQNDDHLIEFSEALRSNIIFFFFFNLSKAFVWINLNWY